VVRSPKVLNNIKGLQISNAGDERGLTDGFRSCGAEEREEWIGSGR
jgi:hypothetical protein